jgi:hypothetical protein
MNAVAPERERMRRTMMGDDDRAESALRSLDEGIKDKSGISLFHLLTAASIVGSLLLFFSGRRTEAIFVGLWPPTFQALKSATEK